MRTRQPITLAAVLPVLLLCGCTMIGIQPSPTTTFVDAAGETVTVDWKDYPASAGVDGDELVDRPDQAELEVPASTLMRELGDAIEEASGLRLTSPQPEAAWFSDANWHPEPGNGYGGDSMLTTVNCCTLEVHRAPGQSRWRAILDAASRVTEDAGLGPLQLEHESDPMTSDPAWLGEYRAQFCTARGGECWMWSATAYDGVQWVTFTIQDGSLDPTGDAVREAAQIGRPAAFIGIDYGATVVRAGMKDEYTEALEPFVGLERPEPTASD